MGIFDEKKSFSRKELRGTLRKSSGVIPKTGGERYSEQQRVELERQAFGKRFGGNISRPDFRGAVRGLKTDKNKAETKKEKRDIGDRINYLKKLGDFK